MQSIARHRRRTERRMPMTVLIRKPGERVPDGRGHYYTQPGDTVETRGRITDMSAQEQVVAQRMSESVEGVCILPADTSVTSADTLEIDGVLYHVRGVPPGTPQYTAHTRVLIARS